MYGGEDKRFEALFSNKIVHIKVEQAINEIMSENGITASQGHILMYIIEHSETAVYSTDIHNELGITRATVSGLVKKLRGSGFVVFEGCEGDERQKVIRPTQKAFELKASLDECVGEIAGWLFSGISDEEIEYLNDIQRRLLSNIKENKKEEK